MSPMSEPKGYGLLTQETRRRGRQFGEEMTLILAVNLFKAFHGNGMLAIGYLVGAQSDHRGWPRRSNIVTIDTQISPSNARAYV